MIRSRESTARWAIGVILVGVAPIAGAADGTVDVSELARCAAIAAANDRLTCYDSLAAVAVPGARISSGGATAPTASGAAASAQPSASTGSVGPRPGASAVDPASRGVGAAADAGSSASPAGAVGAAPTAPSTNPDDPVNFGLTQRQLKPVAGGPSSEKAVVSQLTVDRLNNVVLVLDNGQTWAFVEPDPRVRPGDSITIKRAALGSFLMMTPSRRSYRVQRVK